MLIIFAGLPGTGKTSIARELARQVHAVYVRIDSIEQAIRDSAAIARPMDDVGYRVGYAVAEDNLRLGRTVVADSVNPIAITRDAWVEVAGRAKVRAVEVEVKCSDAEEHRRRVEGRTAPTWNEVVSREYHPWSRERVVIETAGRNIEECVSDVRKVLAVS